MAVVRFERVQTPNVACTRRVKHPTACDRKGRPLWERCPREAYAVRGSRAQSSGRESRSPLCFKHARETSDRVAVPLPGERWLFQL